MYMGLTSGFTRHAYAWQAGLALLVGWPGETALQRAVAGALFHTMVQRRNTGAQLAGIDAWRQLAGWKHVVINRGMVQNHHLFVSIQNPL